MRPRNIIGQPALDLIKTESVALKRLAEIEEAFDKAPEEGGYHATDRERQFVRDIRRKYDARHELTAEQRDRIKHLWELVRKGESPTR